eukprot:CAMPEP_0201285750 /NCGR_PEP_ID=MMETSP1317-20130820/113762_1 /ASSEMBLY_ACC=CAM_ASM_000770 /TAXON_ID=187299 /ORGANISM="Undescribed Undescribed, Strain Undescribed" /LENGTH=80 /DNA_ID=CAMNT_0047611613 /DNA_START=1019 /DNA_END=1264 /DNA_ORIENTATION=+
MANLESGVEWSEVLSNTKILDFLHKNLAVGYADDDIVLECIMLIGVMISDSRSAKLISNSMIIRLLHTLLSEKSEDDEMV